MLGVVALVFIVLYFTKPSEKVNTTLDDIAVKAKECQTKVAAWQSVNGTQGATASAQAKTELDNILKDCNATFEASQNKL